MPPTRGRPAGPREEPQRPRQRRPEDAPDREPEPMGRTPSDPSRFERAFCSLVAYERPRRLLELLDEQREVLTCDCARFFELSNVQFTPKHPHFRQAARCAEILAGHSAADIVCVDFAPTDDGSGIELSVALRGSTRWDSTTTLEPTRLASAWLEARGDT